MTHCYLAVLVFAEVRLNNCDSLLLSKVKQSKESFVNIKCIIFRSDSCHDATLFEQYLAILDEVHAKTSD